jgi:hypothetical protein
MDEELREVEEVEIEEIERLSFDDSIQSLQRRLEETDDPDTILAISKAIAALNDTLSSQESAADKMQLEIDKLEVEKGKLLEMGDIERAKLTQELAIEERKMETQEKSIRATRFAAILGLGGVLLTAGLRIVETIAGTQSQGDQAIRYLDRSEEIERDENLILNEKRHLIPPLFTKK